MLSAPIRGKTERLRRLAYRWQQGSLPTASTDLATRVVRRVPKHVFRRAPALAAQRRTGLTSFDGSSGRNPRHLGTAHNHRRGSTTAVDPVPEPILDAGLQVRSGATLEQAPTVGRAVRTARGRRRMPRSTRRWRAVGNACEGPSSVRWVTLASIPSNISRRTTS